MKRKHLPGELKDRDYIPSYLYTSIPCLKLDAVMQGYQRGGYETSYYYDRETDTVIRIYDWHNIPEEIEFDEDEIRYVSLPNHEDIPDIMWMYDFIETVDNQKKKRNFLTCVSWGNSLKAFRNTARNNGLRKEWDEWYDYSFRRFLISWCIVNGCDWI